MPAKLEQNGASCVFNLMIIECSPFGIAIDDIPVEGEQGYDYRNVKFSGVSRRFVVQQ